MEFSNDALSRWSYFHCEPNPGLLVLGPIILNILAFHTLVEHGQDLVPVPLVLGALAFFLLCYERKKFLGLLN